MGINRKQPFYLEVAKGRIEGHSIVHKFGAGTLGATLGVVTQSSFYRTPLTAQALEFVSDDANDTAAGSGAQEVTVIGLDTNWNEVTQVIETDGLTPVALPTNLFRLYRWYVSRSGTYATQTTGSHVGVLTIQGAGGGDVWSQMGVTPFPSGQSQIGAYTVPVGKTGYLIGKVVFVDTVKAADIYFFQRQNADDVTTPFTGTMRLVEREVGVQGGFDHHFSVPKTPFIGPCDVGFMGVVSAGTADVSVEFELLLVDN